MSVFLRNGKKCVNAIRETAREIPNRGCRRSRPRFALMLGQGGLRSKLTATIRARPCRLRDRVLIVYVAAKTLLIFANKWAQSAAAVIRQGLRGSPDTGSSTSIICMSA